MADNHLLNVLIKAEDKARKEAMKKSKDERDHPGMERYEDEEDFWAEVAEANEDAKASS